MTEATVIESHWQSDMRDGLRDVAPVLGAVVPFAAVFGAVAAEAGMGMADIMLASATIYAGASQFVMVELMGQDLPIWSIVLAVFALNFRHVLYSASLGRHMGAFGFWQKALAFHLLVDPQFAASEMRALKTRLRPTYYFSYATAIYSVWLGANLLGILFGALIDDPAAWGMDFLLPLYFMGLIMGFHGRGHFWVILSTSAVASIIVHQTLGSPWHITLGGGVGLVVAAALSKPKEAEAAA
ncbi:AzlC family ABC transporter permease [uncultured Pelagimonas sp.]|uniref:AzlC family ABC transporter permease n=1 Tax=uncultured Pelagimonas sp. TaxID=1618102 RepID=UPI00262C86E8|nr:AzlC family ABC transporter permease [uncultured Pelagimonas sp.]